MDAIPYQKTACAPSFADPNRYAWRPMMPVHVFGFGRRVSTVALVDTGAVGWQGLQYSVTRHPIEHLVPERPQFSKMSDIAPVNFLNVTYEGGMRRRSGFGRMLAAFPRR